MAYLIRIIAIALIVGAFFYWLFADTFRRYGKTAKDQPLVVAHWGDHIDYQMWSEIFEAFSQKYPEIKFERRHLPASRYHQKIQQQIVSDTAPDLFMMQDEPFPNLIASGKLEDLSPYIKAMDRWGEDGEIVKGEYWKTAVRDFGEYHPETKEWEQWGMPVWGGCNLLFYNKENWNRAQTRVGENPDAPGLRKGNDGWWYVNDDKWTLEEFVEICQRLTMDLDGDGRTDQYAFFVPWWGWMPIHWTVGASVLNEDFTRTTFYGPECEASLTLLQDLRLKYKVMPAPSALGALTMNTAFFTGMVSILNTGTYGLIYLNATGIDYDILHFPRGEGGRRYTRFFWEGMAMSSLSKNKKEAWIFLDFLTSIDGQRILAEYQISLPSLIASEPFFLNAARAPVSSRQVDLYKFTEAARTYARRQPISVHYGPMERAIVKCMSALIAENEDFRLTPRQAIARYLFESPELLEKLPPVDLVAAEEYRPDWEAMRQ